MTKSLVSLPHSCASFANPRHLGHSCHSTPLLPFRTTQPLRHPPSAPTFFCVNPFLSRPPSTTNLIWCNHILCSIENYPPLFSLRPLPSTPSPSSAPTSICANPAILRHPPSTPSILPAKHLHHRPLSTVFNTIPAIQCQPTHPRTFIRLLLLFLVPRKPFISAPHIFCFHLSRSVS